MYNQQAIDTLVNRIGWSEISDLPVAVSTSNETAESGKAFSFYHPLVTVENIYYAIDKVNISEEDLNKFLSELRNQAVLKILTDILDKHRDYDPLKDYSSIIINRSAMFDNAIGYCVAIKIIEIFISSKRSNLVERNAKMAYQTLKIELEGAKNENGYNVAKGLTFYLAQSIKKVQRILFPIIPVVKDGNAW